MIKYVLQIAHYIFSHHSLIFLKGKSLGRDKLGNWYWHTHTTTDKVDFNDFSNNKLSSLNTTCGTVTITALDFAIKCGFTEIQILGADFGYVKNKTYTKSTYLDQIFSKNQNKLEN